MVDVRQLQCLVEIIRTQHQGQSLLFTSACFCCVFNRVRQGTQRSLICHIIYETCNVHRTKVIQWNIHCTYKTRRLTRLCFVEPEYFRLCDTIYRVALWKDWKTNLVWWQRGVGVFWRTYNVLLLILVKQTIQNPNPRDATLSSLSNLFYSQNSKWPPSRSSKFDFRLYLRRQGFLWLYSSGYVANLN